MVFLNTETRRAIHRLLLHVGYCSEASFLRFAVPESPREVMKSRICEEDVLEEACWVHIRNGLFLFDSTVVKTCSFVYSIALAP